MLCRGHSWWEGMGIGKWPGQLIPRGSKVDSKMSNLDAKN